MVSGDLPHRIKAFHEKYGPVVRIAPDEVSFTDPSAWKDIYPKNFVRPREHKDKPPGKNAENLISASEPDHARFRKILAPAFSERAVTEQEAMIVGHVDLLISTFSKMIHENGAKGRTVVDLLQWLNYTFFDIIGDFVWGSSFDCLGETQEHPWIQVIAQFKFALIAGAFKYYPPFDSILTAITPKSAMADLWMIWKTTEEKIARRLASPENSHKDVIFHMLEANRSSSMPHITDEEIEINSMLLIIAGSESTTTVILGIINYLLRNPKSLEILTQEVRASYPTSDTISGVSLSKLPYLNAVFHEGLRICPTFPDGFRREIPEGGAAVAGHFLPAATVVSVPQWAAYRSPDNYHEPEQFLPERWLEDASNPAGLYAQDRRDVFNPFLLGPHNCPGKNLAYLESRLLLAKLVWHFDLEAEHVPVWDKQNIYWFWEKQPMKVTIKEAG